MIVTPRPEPPHQISDAVRDWLSGHLQGPVGAQEFAHVRFPDALTHRAPSCNAPGSQPRRPADHRARARVNFFVESALVR
jgi:hypothetical protein